MTRYRFETGKWFPARLHAVLLKPIENRLVSLLRLEFEVFQLFEVGRRLKSTGKIACRDLAVGSGLEVDRDPGTMPFVSALGISNADDLKSWLGLIKRRPWVNVEFGEVDPRDSRTEFRGILPFEINGWQLSEYNYDRTDQWVTVGAAATDLGISPATIRRLIEQHADEFGNELVRRTHGNHRRIHLRLLQNLLPKNDR